MRGIKEEEIKQQQQQHKHRSNEKKKNILVTTLRNKKEWWWKIRRKNQIPTNPSFYVFIKHSIRLMYINFVLANRLGFDEFKWKVSIIRFALVYRTPKIKSVLWSSNKMMRRKKNNLNSIPKAWEIQSHSTVLK